MSAWPFSYAPPTVPAPPPDEPAPARPRLPNGLYVWRPSHDESPYWAQPLPMTPEQAEYNRRKLDAPLEKQR